MEYPIDDLSSRYREQYSAVNQDSYHYDIAYIKDENIRLKMKLNKMNVHFQKVTEEYDSNLMNLSEKNAKLEQVCRKLAEKVAEARSKFKEYKSDEEYRSQEQSSHLIERIYELERKLSERKEESENLRRMLHESEQSRSRDETKIKRFQELLRSEFNT